MVGRLNIPDETLVAPKLSASNHDVMPVLSRRTGSKGKLRIATLSWDLDAAPDLSVTPETFRKALHDGRERILDAADLVVSAGCSVSDLVPPKELMAVTRDVPVLFECGQQGGRCWRLVHHLHGVALAEVLRSKQLVTRFDQLPEMSVLAQLIDSGAGFFRFVGLDANLLLLVCGENNILDPDGQTSVLRGSLGDINEHSCRSNLREWILINAAHRPYWPQIRSTGFCKVGQDSRQAGPTLRRLVEQKRSYRDGTSAPLAVVHCNNFYGHESRTKPYASLAFANPRCAVVSERPGNQASWLWSCHALALAAANTG